MPKCRYCRKKLDSVYYYSGIFKFCNYICAFKQTYKNKPINNSSVGDHSETRFVPQIEDLSLSKGTEQKSMIYDRDSKYLEFIRKQQCCVCPVSVGVHAHHTESGGMGMKSSDYCCVPLCADHHTAGTDAVHRLGAGAFQKKFNADFQKEQIKLLRKYIRYLNERKS